MAQKKDREIKLSGKKIAQRPAVVGNVNTDGKINIPHSLLVTGIVFITWLCLRSALGNQFADWDDKGYLLNNELVRDISPAGLRAIFSTPVMGNYHPITILLYAIEYSGVQYEPWLYHFNSLLLHFVAVALAYVLAYRLTMSKVAAVVTALLFGIHPMHVEPVAWIAGRKDVLYTLFYFASCIAYLSYLRQGPAKTKWYVACLAFFLFSLLSKPVAVTLPVALLLIDFYQNRAFSKRVFLEKVPFFVLSLVFGILSATIQHGGGAMAANRESYTIIERCSLAGYALFTYLSKAVLPLGLHVFYAYPAKVNGALPVVYYLFPAVAGAIVFLVWRYWRHLRWLVFGLLFFVLNILLLLQLIPVGDAIVSERYAYLPYFGLFLITGLLVSFASGYAKFITYAAIGCVAAVFGYLSYVQCPVWYDARSLWTDELKKEPAPIAFNNLGFYFFEKGNMAINPTERKSAHDSALILLNKAVAMKPDFVNAYEGLGILCFMARRFDSSAWYFRMLKKVKPSAEAYYDYGAALYELGKKDSALSEYTTSLSMNPRNGNAYLNRGIIYKEKALWAQARYDLEQAITINPAAGAAYYHRSFCDTQAGNRSRAINDIDKAISLGFKEVDPGYYRSLKGN